MLGALAGCVPAMTRPPPVHPDGAVDSRLIGIWLSGKDEPGFTFIGEDDGKMRAALVNVLDNGRLEVDEFEFYRAASGPANLLMVTDDDNKGKERRYLVIRYQFDGDHRFRIHWLSSKRVKLAIERGDIQGRVVRGRWIDDVLITAPHAAAVEWMEAHEDAWDTEHSIWFNRLERKKLECPIDAASCPQ